MTLELESELLQRLMNGEGLNTVCKSDPRFPAESTIRLRVLEDAEFAAKYTRAREIGYMVRADQIIEKAEDRSRDVGENAGIAIQRDRLIVDTWKWMLGKTLPKIFGDKQQVEHSGEVAVKRVVADV